PPTLADSRPSWTSTWFSRPSGVPIHFCSMNRTTEYPGLGARSWHGLERRPTAFLDGHAKILSTPQYTNDSQDIMRANATPVGLHSLRTTNHGNAGDYALGEY